MSLRSFITAAIFGAPPPLGPQESLGYVLQDASGNVVMISPRFDELKQIMEGAEENFQIQRCIIKLIPDRLRPGVTYQINNPTP